MHTANQVFIALLLSCSLLGMLIRANLIDKERTVTYQAKYFTYSLIWNVVFAAWLLIEIWPKI